MNFKSYIGKTFTVSDADARIRQSSDLLQYIFYAAGDTIPAGKDVGEPKTIPQETQISVLDAKSIGKKLTFVYAAPDGGGMNDAFGWTSITNLKDGFLNETLGQLIPTGNDPHGINAAWDGGNYIGQKSLVEIIGNNSEVKHIVADNLDHYLKMVEAAGTDGVKIALNSGFRTFPEQQLLYTQYKLNPAKNEVV